MSVAPITSVPLVIGRRYRVPHVWAQWWSVKPRWLPVFGPKHDDAEHIGFDQMHYHVDPRFLDKRTWKYQTAFSRGSLEVTGKPISDGRAPHHYNMLGVPAPTMKTVKCKREWPIEAFRAKARTVWLGKLEDAYACQRLKNRICPHRGADLTSVAPNADGTITCPLHGLRWSVETGELVRG